MIKMKKVIVLCGMPGSGKTTKAKELAKQYEKTFPTGWNSGRKVKIWSLDNYLHHHPNDSLKKFFKDIDKSFDFFNVHILDGLFIRQHHYQRVIDEFEFRDVEFEFHYFEFDIEGCLWNDKYRRDVDSTLTLENALYEYPDLSKLNYENKKVELFHYPITRKDQFQMFMDKYQLGSSVLLTSDNWTTGGDWRDCWGDGGEYRAEDQPVIFKELHEVLEKIDPNITSAMCQDIQDTFATVEDDSESDYYGGCKYFSYYQINYHDILQCLHDLHVIDKDNL